MSSATADSQEKPLSAVLPIAGSRYRVVGQIGEGATSVVYEVEDRADGGKRKALKVLRPGSPDGADDGIDAMRSEFRVAARFRHPNLVECLELDYCAERHCAAMLMERIDGRPLGGEGVSASSVPALAVELLQGLAFLHGCGYVHGDIKPSNAIGFEEDGRLRVKLLDFHLAGRAVPAPEDLPRGTLLYMAPEVIEGNAPTPRSDLYSAGCLLYQALTGAPPFVGSPREIVSAHLCAPPNLGADGIDGKMSEVLNRLLAKRPEARYRTAQEGVEAVRGQFGDKLPAVSPRVAVGRVRSAPLVDRAVQMSAFSKFIANPFSRAMLLSGPKGSGRTRLLREFEIDAQAEGFLAVNASLRDGLAPVLLAAAWKLCAHPCESGDPFVGQLAGICDALRREAPERRAIFLVDDAETMPKKDRSDFLRFLRGGVEAGALFCVSVPADDTGDADWVKSCIEDDFGGLDVRVGEFDEKAAVDFARAAVPWRVSAEEARRFALKCGRNPATMVASIEWLLFDAPETKVSLDRAPASFEHLAKEIVSGYDPGAVLAIKLLALSGDEMPVQSIALETGCSEEDLAAFSRDALAGAIRFREEEGRSLVRLSNRLLADAVAALIPAEAARRLHDTIFGIEDREFPDRPARRLTALRHRVLGSSPGEAIDDLLGLAADEEFGDRAQDIIDLVQTAQDYSPASKKLDLIEAEGDLFAYIGDFARAATAYLRAIDLAGRRNAPSRLTRKAAIAVAEKGSVEEAWEIFNRTQDPILEDSHASSAERAVYYLALSRIQFLESQYGESVCSAKQAATLAASVGSATVQGKALVAAGIALLEASDRTEAFRLIEESLECFERSGSPAGRGLGLYGMARVEFNRENFDAAEAHARESETWLRKTGKLGGTANLLALLGMVRHCYHDWDGAARLYTEAHDIYARLGQAIQSAICSVNRSQVNAYRGDLPSAISQAEKSMALGDHANTRRCFGLLRMAQILYDLGELKRAERCALEVLRLAKASDLNTYSELALRTLGEIKALEGEFGKAIELLDQALGIAVELGLADREIVCLSRLAEARAASGELSGAIEDATAALEASEALGTPSKRAIALLAAGKAHLAADNLDIAHDTLLAAEEIIAQRAVWDSVADVNLALGKVCLRQERHRACAVFLRHALDAVEQVVQFLDSAQRATFLKDPRRGDLFATLSELRAQTGSAKET